MKEDGIVATDGLWALEQWMQRALDAERRLQQFEQVFGEAGSTPSLTQLDRMWQLAERLAVQEFNRGIEAVTVPQMTRRHFYQLIVARENMQSIANPPERK